MLRRFLWWAAFNGPARLAPWLVGLAMWRRPFEVEELRPKSRIEATERSDGIIHIREVKTP